MTWDQGADSRVRLTEQASLAHDPFLCPSLLFKDHCLLNIVRAVLQEVALLFFFLSDYISRVPHNLCPFFRFADDCEVALVLGS